MKERLWAVTALVTHTPPPLRDGVSGSLQTEAESTMSNQGLHQGRLCFQGLDVAIDLPREGLEGRKHSEIKSSLF